MNKPADLDLSALDLSKTVMYEFWYDYVKPKYGNESLLYEYRQLHCSCKKKMIFTKTLLKILKKQLALQIQRQTDRCLKEKSKKVIELMKVKLGGKIMKKKLLD